MTIGPATQLPWDFAILDNAIIPGAYVVDSSGDKLRTNPFDNEADAGYVAHACNAYPELVAALRLAADDLLDGDYETRAGYVTEIRALLAKLGESA